MKPNTFFCLAALCLLAALLPAQEQMQGSKIASTPQWEKIKSLVGEWEGYAMENGHQRHKS